MAFLVMSLDKTGRTLELVDTCLKNVAIQNESPEH